MTKRLFHGHVNGKPIILLTTLDGKEFVWTSQGELIPLEEYTKYHPIGGHRQDDDQEKRYTRLFYHMGDVASPRQIRSKELSQMIEQRVWTGYSKEGHFMQLVMNKEEASPYKGPPLIHYVFQCGKEQVETNHLPFLQIKILLRQILEESRWKGAEVKAAAGGGMLSSYRMNGEKFWIDTVGFGTEHVYTVVMLPSEY